MKQSEGRATLFMVLGGFVAAIALFVGLIVSGMLRAGGVRAVPSQGPLPTASPLDRGRIDAGDRAR